MAKKRPQVERVLNREGLEMQEEFEDLHGDGSCYCHINPPCSWCTHPGNPMNLEENEDVWTNKYVE